MQNNQTPYLGLPLPDEANLLSEDLPRLQQALNAIDETLGTLEQNRISQGDTSVTVTDTGDGKVVFTLNGVEVAGVHEKFAIIPRGTTAERPAQDTLGAIRYNTDTGFFETFTVSGWGAIATPPTITTISPLSYNGEQGTEFTINGAFFDAMSEVKFISQNGQQYAAGAVTFVNASQLKATTPRDFKVSDEPLSISVTNSAGLTAVSAPLIDCGSVPTWNTQPGNLVTTAKWNDPVSVFVSAGDAEGTIENYAITSGALPAGVAINAATGQISGTPGAQNTTTYTFTIEAADNAGNTSSRQFTIIVSNAPPSWSTAAGTLVTTTQWNSPISATITATDPEGQAVTYSIISGSLPAGVTLNSATGEISGTVSGAPDAASKTVQFTAAATDAQGGQATRQFAVQLVNAAPVWQSPAAGATLTFNQGLQSSQALTATDPEGQPVTFATASGIVLPTGLSLSGSAIVGTPQGEWNTAVTVEASDGFVKTPRTFYILVKDELYAFDSFTFTTVGATGNYGPDLSAMQSAYAGAAFLNGYFTASNGLQRLTVPRTAYYTLLMAGSVGGATANKVGGAGASFTTSPILLSKGDILDIGVGQIGLQTADGHGSGGGGASWVYNRTKSQLLAVAGGGGGAGNTCFGRNAENSENGGGGSYGTDFGTTINNGGINGYGGTTDVNNGASGTCAWGGAGWLGNGPNDSQCGRSGGSMAYALNNGGQGGVGQDNRGHGGFGGGGGGANNNGYGGGGGGYSGGGPGGFNNGGGGGGGGSYSINSRNNFGGNNGAGFVRLIMG